MRELLLTQNLEHLLFPQPSTIPGIEVFTFSDLTIYFRDNLQTFTQEILVRRGDTTLLEYLNLRPQYEDESHLKIRDCLDSYLESKLRPSVKPERINKPRYKTCNYS